ncbi:MAG: hypothetical protein F6K50_12905, partial [Moorea sp. SIO3I7]|nr:hypothetical protein [Moorena sp. SIO3I7]
MEPFSFLAGLELSKIASPLLGTVAGEAGKRIVKALTKSDVEKAIKAGEDAVKEWEKQLEPS